MTGFSHYQGCGDLPREADRDPIAVVGREPVQAEASAQRRAS